MGNMPDIKNGRVTIRLSLELAAKLRRQAIVHSMDVSECARWIIGKQLDKVKLTEEDTAWINAGIRKNKQDRENNKAKRRTSRGN